MRKGGGVCEEGKEGVEREGLRLEVGPGVSTLLLLCC